MSGYIGDFANDALVHFPFTTNAADGGRESTSASLEEGDIGIYSTDGDGTWTLMTLDASTIIISENPDSKVGTYLVAVDMSNDADFTTGKDYVAVLYPDETVDSQSIAGILAHWSCENRGVQSVRGAVASVTGAVGSVTGNVGGDVQGNVDGTVAGVTPGTLTQAQVTGGAYALDTDANGRMRIVDGTGAGELDTDSGTVLLRSATEAQIDAIESDTNEMQGDLADGGRLDLIFDAILVDTGTTLDNLVDDLESRLGTPSDLGGGATIAQNLADMAGGADFNSSTNNLAVVGNSIVAAVSAVDDPGAAATTTSFNTDLTEADGYWDDHTLVFTGGPLAGQSAPIKTYSQTNGAITVDADDAFTAAPGNNDTFNIKADHVHPVSQIAQSVLDEDASSHTNNSTLGAIINDWEDAGRLDAILDELTTQGDTNETAIGNLNDLSAAQVNAEVDSAIETYRLDHLLAVADSDDPVDNSVIAKLVSATGDWSTFVPSTDSLEAQQAEHDASQSAIAALNDLSADDVWDEPVTEPTGMFAWASATPRKIVGTLGVLMRNEIHSDSDSVDVRNDADDANLWSYASSDDGTTFISGEAA